MTPFEKACRALCKLDGHPENITFEGKPMWMSYRGKVAAVLMALEEPSRMMVAAATIKAEEIGPNDHVGIWRAMLRAIEE